MGYRFSYVKYDEESSAKQNKLKIKCEELEALISYELKDGRPRQLALTNLEQTYMWIGKSIRDSQVVRTNEVDEQPERSNS